MKTPLTERPDFQLTPEFFSQSEADNLFSRLESEIDWDTSMKARKTACYGETYDESGIDYEVQPMHELLIPVCQRIEQRVDFLPTNCLLNYYQDGSSTMGFHSDTISNLEPGTGIVIVSLGAERELMFRNKENFELRFPVLLLSGSLFYMTSETQNYWSHAIKKAKVDEPRISLTFRRILADLKNAG